MDLIFANLKNCYNLSEIGDQSIVDLSGNYSTEIIKDCCLEYGLCRALYCWPHFPVNSGLNCMHMCYYESL